MIYFTSDLHFGHDREFIYVPRGFQSVEEMNETILSNWNNKIKPEDEVYVLGDIALGNPDNIINYFTKLNGKITIIRGNHDTDTRINIYKNKIICPSVTDVYDAKYLKAGGYHIYLTHYPCLCGNLHHDSLKKTTINFHGHTHSKNPFLYDLPYCYNVAVDAHNCTPVSLEEAIQDMENKVTECVKFL